MNRDRFLTAISTECRRMAESARGQDLDTPVPTCEGWTVRDVVAHTGSVLRHKADIVARNLAEPPDAPDAPADGLVEWFQDGARSLIDVLASTDPSAAAWTWHEPDQTAGFWYRRMAHETAIHRADVESPTGTVTPVESDLAADGIDEIVTTMLTGVPAWGRFDAEGQAVDLVARDVAKGWHLRLGRFRGTSPTTGTTYDLPAADLQPSTETADRSADATIGGAVNDLLLWIWGRGPIDALTVDGDRSAASALRDVAADATG